MIQLKAQVIIALEILF